MKRIRFGLVLVLLLIPLLAGCYSQEDINDAYAQGHSEGESDGYSAGYSAGQEDGYNDGYQKGYDQGYLDGEAYAENIAPPSEPTEESLSYQYVANKNTGKFHLPSCSSVNDIKPKNRLNWDGTRDELIAQGYVPCKRCNP